MNQTIGESWKEIVISALRALGGEAHLDELNSIIAKHPRTKSNTHWREKVRQVVRRYKAFEPVPPERSGIYRLSEETEIQPKKQKLTNDIIIDHGTTQGMLLVLGNLFGYETFAPKYDQTARTFQNQSLTQFASIKDLSDEVSSPELKRLRQVDVLWFDEDDIGIFPRYAFEVEHTTRVKSGIDRLLQIPERYSTQLFIIAPSSEEKLIFDKCRDKSPYKQHATKLHFHLYSEIEHIYNHSISFSHAVSSFNVVIKSITHQQIA